ncbi:hypothetical protein MLD38_015622 [Melastoma candidum]|uniref:Uncharacterized protein n=1 Tax=Melastoma candidum TaxID=119954 RepID=A0ACB9RGL3_9MYRT|nr:hypothetical protein MLD38_015622 [Melastoma candidum]
MTTTTESADAHKQKLQQQDDPGLPEAPSATKNVTTLADQDQRKALKFGFSTKGGTSKNSSIGAAEKPNVNVASVFGNDSDDE